MPVELILGILSAVGIITGGYIGSRGGLLGGAADYTKTVIDRLESLERRMNDFERGFAYVEEQAGVYGLRLVWRPGVDPDSVDMEKYRAEWAALGKGENLLNG